MLLNIFPVAALNSSVYLVICYWIHTFFLCESRFPLFFVCKYHFCFFLFWETLIIAGLNSPNSIISAASTSAVSLSPFSSQLSCDSPRTAQSLSVNTISVALRVWGTCFVSVALRVWGTRFAVASTLQGFLSSSILSIIVDLFLSSHPSKTDAVSLRSGTTLPLPCTLGNGLSWNPFKYGP